MRSWFCSSPLGRSKSYALAEKLRCTCTCRWASGSSTITRWMAAGVPRVGFNLSSRNETSMKLRDWRFW